MVARKRFTPLSLGAEIAQDVRGFSRISPEVFARNKHSGLYCASTRKSKRSGGVNGAYTKRNQMKSKVSFRSKFVGQKGKKFARPSGRKCNFKNVFGQQQAEPVRILVNPNRMNRPVKKRGQTRSKSKKVVQEKSQQDIDQALLNFKLRGVMKKFEQTFEDLEDLKMTRRQYVKKLNVLNELMWNCKELSLKARKAKGILISNQVSWEKKLVREKI